MQSIPLGPGFKRSWKSSVIPHLSSVSWMAKGGDPSQQYLTWHLEHQIKLPLVNDVHSLHQKVGGTEANSW